MSAAVQLGGACLYAYAFDHCKRRVALRNQFPLMGGPVAWVDLAYLGTWKGHRRGEFSFTEQTFAEIIRNFQAQKNAIPIDYDHESEFMPPPWPARGWGHEIKVERFDDGPHLLVRCEFGKDAAARVRAGEYPFTSGVFDFDAIDRVSGEPIGCELVSIALCARPFIDGQEPIRLSRSRQGARKTMSTVNKAELISHLRRLEADDVSADQVQKLASALGLLAEAKSPPATPGEEPGGEATPPAPPEDEKEEKKPATALSAEMAAPGEMPATPPSAAPEAPPADPQPDASALASQLMEATGMDLAALTEALKGLAKGGVPAAPAPLSDSEREHSLALSARDHTIRSLSQRVESAEAEVARYREREADDAVSVLIDSGRILDNARADMRTLYLSNRKAFDSLSAALPEVVPIGKHAAGQTPPTQQTPAIDESDPEVQSLRRSLSNTRLNKAQQDAAIAQRIAARKQTQTTV